MQAAGRQKTGSPQNQPSSPVDKKGAEGGQVHINPGWQRLALREQAPGQFAGRPPLRQAVAVAGAPGDELEQEADRVADGIMAMPDNRIASWPDDSGACLDCIQPAFAGPVGPVQREIAEEEKEEAAVQGKTDASCSDRGCFTGIEPALPGPVGPVQREIAEGEKEDAAVQMKTDSSGRDLGCPKVPKDMGSLQSGGRPLDPSARSFFEPRFQASLDHVRIHTDSTAAASAASIQALAYTHKNNIVFNNSYEPESRAGRRLLAHELTHVFQQGKKDTVRRTMTRQQEIELSRTTPGRFVGRARPPAFSIYNFAIDSPDLKDEHRAFLTELARLINSTNPALLGVRITGHASTPGDAGHNESLSRSRAESVASFLAANGITHTAVRWRGERSPVASNATVAGRTRNRRVDLNLYLRGVPPIPDPDIEPPGGDGDDTFFCFRYPLICLAIGGGLGLAALLLFCLLNPAVCFPIPWPPIPPVLPPPIPPPVPPGTPPEDGDDSPDRQPLRPGTPFWVHFKKGYPLMPHLLDTRFSPIWIPGAANHAHAYAHKQNPLVEAMFMLPPDDSTPISVTTRVRVKESGMVRGETGNVRKTGSIVHARDLAMDSLFGSTMVGQYDYTLDWEWSNSGLNWVTLGSSGVHPLFWIYAGPKTSPLYTPAVSKATGYASTLVDPGAIVDYLRMGPRVIDKLPYDPGDDIDLDPLMVYMNMAGSICSDYANLLVLLCRSMGFAAHPVMFYGGFKAKGHSIWVSLDGSDVNLINVRSARSKFNPPLAERAWYSPLGWDFNYHAIASVGGVYHDAVLDRRGPPKGSALHEGLLVRFVELGGSLPEARVGVPYHQRIPRLVRRVTITYNHYSSYITNAAFGTVVTLPVPWGTTSPYYTPLTWSGLAMPPLASVGLSLNLVDGIITGTPTEPVGTRIIVGGRYTDPDGVQLEDFDAFRLDIRS